MKISILLRPAIAALALCAVSGPVFAQNPPAHIPPAGIEVSAADRDELSKGAASLRQEINALGLAIANNSQLTAHLPDVEIFHKAVDWALRYNEFFSPKEVAFAKHLLEEGHERVVQMRLGKMPWLDAAGLVVRGYRSKIDGSIQPFGLVVPEGAKTANNRAMVWLLGRGEKRTELAFLAEREGGLPQLTPSNTLIVVPYGRFCNATKFAGETDVFEALNATKTDYQIDPQRILVAGFSMGGGSTWHLAIHYSGFWCAASPGAGFSETPEFTKALAPGKEPRPPWEQKLWAQYDAINSAANAFNSPIIAYSGETDGQKQAADIAETAMAKEGLKLERFIGPKTGHAYEPETKKVLTARLEELLAKGREITPREVHLATYTLRYPEASWVCIEGMGEHWQRADVKARFTDDKTIVANTKNVTQLSFDGVQAKTVVLDGQNLSLKPNSKLFFINTGGKWKLSKNSSALRKRPGLTGPIDDAIVEPFLFVRSTGKPLNEKVGTWVTSEMDYSKNLWRDVFRGNVQIKNDNALNDADIQSKNLILWGDPSSNALIAKIIKRLPLKWDAKKLIFRGKTYDASHYAPILIFPNPLNPQHYIVINSGLDFRADGYGNNALQTPKLPDWAIIDLNEPPSPRWPGKVVDAGFFNEEWK